MLSGFRNFILRGNLVDLAVAVIIGTAFAAVVTAFTQVLLTIIGKIFGGDTNFNSWEPHGIPLGTFVTALIAFLIMAAVLYFFVVTPFVTLKEKFFPSAPPGTPEDIKLLAEIRDLLRTQQGLPPAE
ncbi:large conductance mechanosensitive channel protein MscL [Nocardioides sp. R-C-SC26]|uniref:large conductance mechanosensitive channel protein MscL n=1 Tax=Nocardioides sp. R-C-SC26 TaxID=2870414 RepID=UPI001E4B5EA8|nr:large conductance mechanosensitive channel protein MscL [Nocardioides sp. R-C-SC26]